MARYQEITLPERYGARLTGKKADEEWRQSHWQKLEMLRGLMRRRWELQLELARDYAAMRPALAQELRDEAQARLEQLEQDLAREIAPA
jgi:hypothetical protein